MKRIIGWLDNLSAFLMLSGAVLGLICVFSRYVLKNAIIWGDEADVYLFIWMLFLKKLKTQPNMLKKKPKGRAK